MEIDLVAEGLKFMYLGMGTVFTFLVVLILVLKLQAKIVDTYFAPKKSVNSTTDNTSSQKDKKKIVAAIASAIHTYRN
jgi:oxaloacetate decarboxylase gamma subunit